MKLPSNIYNCPVIVQASLNGFRDKRITDMAYFSKLKDAVDFIVKTSTMPFGADSQSDIVTELLGIPDEYLDKYLPYNAIYRFCEDTGIPVPCGVAVYFLTDGEKLPRSVPLTYLPHLKKFVNRSRIL